MSTTGQCAETKRLWIFSPECDVCITCFSSGLGRFIQKREWKDLKSEKWWMTVRKLCLPGTLGQMHIWAHRDCHSIHKTYTLKPVKISAWWRKGGWYEVASLPEELLAFDCSWKGESCFLNGVRSGIPIRGYGVVIDQHKLDLSLKKTIYILYITV